MPDEASGEQWPADPVAGMSIFLDDAMRVFPQIESRLAGDVPDIVLYDIGGYPGRALAERHGIPLLQMSPSMVAWEGFEDDMAESLTFRVTPEYAAYQERFAAWLAELGIDMTPDEFNGRPPRCIVLVPKVMQPNADRVDPRAYTFVGPALDRRDGRVARIAGAARPGLAGVELHQATRVLPRVCGGVRAARLAGRDRDRQLRLPRRRSVRSRRP